LSMEATEVTVSAPGKILLVGGYLVLQQGHGLVIGVDKRFYCTCTMSSVDSSETMATICSPQLGEEWTYNMNDKNTFVPGPQNQSTNLYVEKTLRVCFLFVRTQAQIAGQCLNFKIMADNDFYSVVPHLDKQRAQRTLSNVLSLPRFLPVSDKNGTILKTGLGSSACLVTCLVGCICNVYGITDVQTIYKLAQICHCYSQGKIGSGFDVSAACYGSQVYQRFPKERLHSILAMLDDDEESGCVSIGQALFELIAASWDGGPTCRLGIGSKESLLQVVMGEVSGGSESPSMARSVLAWKNAHQNSENVPFWNDLEETNKSIISLLKTLDRITLTPSEIRMIASTRLSEQELADDKHRELVDELHSLTRLFKKSRELLKAMGLAAGVPIEPDEQTALADATAELCGVVVALVPGAGGYDAIACLYLNDMKVRQSICDLWTASGVCPLTVQAGDSGEGLLVDNCFIQEGH